MYFIFIYDVVLGFYFNCGFEFILFDFWFFFFVDDVVWEVSNVVECVEVLGFCGFVVVER